MAEMFSIKDEENEENEEINNSSLELFSSLSKDEKISFVENELKSLLDYVEQQIELCNEQSSQVSDFSRFTFEAKKMLVEQKINILKQLFHIQKEQNEEEDVNSLTELLNRKLK